MSLEELVIWAAGFIDGEGSISVYKRSDRRFEFSVRLSVVNTNIASLERLQSLFNGSIQPLHRDTPLKNWKPSFIWVVSGRLAEVAIRQLLPYLFIKRPQAELALEARAITGKPFVKRTENQLQAMEKICNQFRCLNKKGRVVLSGT